MQQQSLVQSVLFNNIPQGLRAGDAHVDEVRGGEVHQEPVATGSQLFTPAQWKDIFLVIKRQVLLLYVHGNIDQNLFTKLYSSVLIKKYNFILEIKNILN